MIELRYAFLLVAMTLGGCKMTARTAMPESRAPSTTAASPALSALAAEYWEKRLEDDPIEATILGDRRFDDRMPDPSPEADRRERARLAALAERVRQLPIANVSDVDRVTRAVLLGEIENDLAQRECALGDWSIDP